MILESTWEAHRYNIAMICSEQNHLAFINSLQIQGLVQTKVMVNWNQSAVKKRGDGNSERECDVTWPQPVWPWYMYRLSVDQIVYSNVLAQFYEMNQLLYITVLWT